MAEDRMQLIHDFSDPILSGYVRQGIAREMTPAEMMAVPGPTQVSNRTIHDRCLEWGSKITRSNGNWVWMMSPLQMRFKIRPPQQHAANSKFDIEKMLEALVLPWSVFIGAEILNKDKLVEIGQGFKKSGGFDEAPDDEMGPCSICGEGVMRAVMAKSGKKIAHKYCVKKQAEAKHAVPEPAEEPELKPELEVPPTEEETEPVPEPMPLPDHDIPLAEEARLRGEPEEVEVASLPRGRYINSVFDLLVERGDPMSNRAVGEALGITPSQAGSSLAQLANQNVVTRVESGVYQAKPGLMRKAGTMGLVISGSIGEHSDRPPAPFGTVPPGYAPVAPRGSERPAPVTFAAVDSMILEPNADEDEILNELLDLMAPNGFKARHLPLIDAFKSCAVALMREINDGI